jgi:hypothetical protein
MCGDCDVRAPQFLEAFLTKLVKFSETAVWVVGILFVVEFVTIFICAYRAGTADEEERHVITRRARLFGLVAGRYWSKSKVLVSRSRYISDISLVDGTAAKTEHLIVRGLKLGFLLFWLTFVFGTLTLLPSEPGIALAMLCAMFCMLCCGVTLNRMGRTEALRKLAEKQAWRKTR